MFLIKKNMLFSVNESYEKYRLNIFFYFIK